MRVGGRGLNLGVLGREAKALGQEAMGLNLTPGPPGSPRATHQHHAVSAAPQGDGRRNHGCLLLLGLLLKMGARA